jgi:hypothetical protein
MSQYTIKIKNKEPTVIDLAPKKLVGVQASHHSGVKIQVQLTTQVIGEETWELCQIFINGNLADIKKKRL